jgi:hypothetical protein
MAGLSGEAPPVMRPPPTCGLSCPTSPDQECCPHPFEDTTEGNMCIDKSRPRLFMQPISGDGVCRENDVHKSRTCVLDGAPALEHTCQTGCALG